MNNNIEELYKNLEGERVDAEYSRDTLSWYSNLSKLPLLTNEEERISLGDKRARALFIERNLRLVKFIAFKYLNSGFPLLDVIQEGNVGLIKAVDNYDINSTTSFSTYAYSTIENNIKRALDEKLRLISIPVNKINELKKYKEKVNTFTKEIGRNPSYEDIAEYLNIDISKVIEFEVINDDAFLINDIVYNEENGIDPFDFASFQIDDLLDEHDIYSSLNSSYLYDIIENTKLTKNELLFLKLYYGLYSGKEHNQEQIKKNIKFI